jgi:hypothetical protein
LPNDRAAEYRRLARDCLRLLQTFSNEEARAALIEMARVWTRLAEKQEEAASRAMPVPLPALAHRHPQPVMQQQEQVQTKKKDNE